MENKDEFKLIEKAQQGDKQSLECLNRMPALRIYENAQVISKPATFNRLGYRSCKWLIAGNSQTNKLKWILFTLVNDSEQLLRSLKLVFLLPLRCKPQLGE